MLVRQVTDSLMDCRLVKGALHRDRLARLVRDSSDAAVATIGEAEPDASRGDFVEALVGAEQVSTRLLLHAMVTGRAMFFSACIAGLARTSDSKVFTLLDSGSRSALGLLFARCGMSRAASDLLVQLVLLARTADLADDVSARHYVITALTEGLIAEYDGDIPVELEETFTYLNEQNIMLARKAARGVMAAFASTSQAQLALPDTAPLRQLPAA